MKHFNKNLFCVLPLFALGLGTTLALDSTAQAQPGGRNGNRQFGQNFGERGEQLMPAPRIAVPTVEELTDALELTPDQQKKMTSVLAEMQKRINNTLTPEQRTKLETLRTQPVAPRFAKDQMQEGRVNGRPERGQGFERQGRRQGMAGQNFRGRGQGFGGGRGFGGGADFGGQDFGGLVPQGRGQAFGEPELGGPEGKTPRFNDPNGGQRRGGRRGMGQGGFRPAPRMASPENDGPAAFGQPPLPQPM